MALIILGKTVCKICNEVICEGQDIVAFHGLVYGVDDPLYFFYDRAFHRYCFLKHPLKDSVVERLISKGDIRDESDI